MTPTEITTLEELLHEVHTEIKIINMRNDLTRIPDTSELIDLISKKIGVIPFTVPKILKLLVETSMLFTFTLVEEDRKNKVRKIEGHIVADGPLLKSIRNDFEEELAVLFTREFTKKYSPEKAVKEYIPMATKFNNTHIGRVGNSAVMSAHFEIIFSRKILNYSKNQIANKLKAVISKSEPLSAFLPASPSKNTSDSRNKNSVNPGNVSEFINFSGKNSIEKTLAVYGIEFYTRVCFKNYNFNGLIKIINDGLISEKKDLTIIKNMLQSIRANSDSDIRLQNHALDINTLQKIINQKIKEADG